MTNNQNKNNNNKLINEKSNQGKNSILEPATTLLWNNSVLLCKCRNTERTVMNGQSRNTATVDTKQNKWI